MVHNIHLIFHSILLYSTSICDIINHISVKNSSYSFTQVARNVSLFTLLFSMFCAITIYILYVKLLILFH